MDVVLNFFIGFFGILVGGVITHYSQKKFYNYQLNTNQKQEIYEKINESLSGLYAGSTKANLLDELPTLLRKLQIWAPDNVVLEFTDFLKTIQNKHQNNQKTIDEKYKEIVLLFRKDLLSRTSLTTDDIYPVSKINSVTNN